MNEKISKSDKDWEAMLTPQEYHITRQKGTERAFTGEYWQATGKEGTYLCRCCGEELFKSETKFDSGCGWPSFYQPIEDEKIEEITDDSMGMRRIEVTCSKCDAHLGHVFPDGPNPTGLRYCINSASIRFDDKNSEIPHTETGK